MRAVSVVVGLVVVVERMKITTLQFLLVLPFFFCFLHFYRYFQPIKFFLIFNQSNQLLFVILFCNFKYNFFTILFFFIISFSLNLGFHLFLLRCSNFLVLFSFRWPCFFILLLPNSLLSLPLPIQLVIISF